jgi:hypothetical protein
MCLIKGAFVGEKNFDVIKMHGTIKKSEIYSLHIIYLGHVVAQLVERLRYLPEGCGFDC